jgi:nucleoside-diphosphate-sugar epimerase
MRIFIAGGGGVVGSRLIGRLVAQGHQVTAGTATNSSHERLRKLGANVLLFNGLDQDAVHRAVAAASPDIVVNQMSALPARLNPRKIEVQLSATNRLRSVGGRNLARAVMDQGVKRFVSQSVAFAYDPDGDGFKTETSPLYSNAPGGFSTVVAAIQQLEGAVLGIPNVEAVVLRYGYLYGPGTHFDVHSGSIAESFKMRMFPIVGLGNGVFSFVHVDDAVSATCATISSLTTGVYNIVDDDPAPVRDWAPFFAQLVRAAPPYRIPIWVARLLAGEYGVYSMTRMPGASNAKAKQELPWSPRYSTWRIGFAAAGVPT